MKALTQIWACLFALGGAPVVGHAQSKPLWPADVQTALQQAQLPAEALAVYIAPLDGPTSAPSFTHRSQAPVNPASLMKLVTTYAALDQLGPTFSWRTELLSDAPQPVAQGVLKGSVYVRSNGNPLWLWETAYTQLSRLRAMGIHTVTGDWVVDNSAWRLPPHDPAAFDQEPLRPYNVGPEATTVQYQTVALSAVPKPEQGVAQLIVEPPMGDVLWPATVPLTDAAPCHEWRQRLRLDWTNPTEVLARGGYPKGCDTQTWHLAPPQAQTQTVRVLQGLWAQLGGRTLGQGRAARTPDNARLLLTQDSPPLADVVRRINKFSNNLMAEQVFLTLGAQSGLEASDTPSQARLNLAQWWQRRLPQATAPLWVNGSGLAREQRISAQSLGQLLALAWQGPLMPDFVASLPLAGQDGTLRRHAPAQGAAHLKTGSLNDVMGVAGYLHRPNGQRAVFVAIVQHPQAAKARPVLNALTNWAMQGTLSKQ